MNKITPWRQKTLNNEVEGLYVLGPKVWGLQSGAYSLQLQDLELGQRSLDWGLQSGAYNPATGFGAGGALTGLGPKVWGQQSGAYSLELPDLELGEHSLDWGLQSGAYSLVPPDLELGEHSLDWKKYIVPST